MADAPTYLLEISALDESNNPVTLRYSTGGYNTLPTDTPSNAYYEDRISDPGKFEQALFSSGRTMGEASISYGDIRLSNADGGLDHLLGYAFDGRSFRLLRLTNAQAPYSSATIVLVGTIEGVDSAQAWTYLALRIYDRRLDLDRPVQTVRYAGTTLSGGPTAEGNEDLKDTPKPLLFGRCYNVPAPCVNPFDLIYQVHDGLISAIQVYDGGVPLTFASNYPDLPTLQAASLRPGKYATCMALGLFRLGGEPEFVVTADVTAPADYANICPGAVARAIMSRMGIANGDVVTSAFNALDAAAPYDCGIWISDDRTGLSAISAILSSVGAAVIPNQLNQFTVYRMEAPGTPTDELTEYEIQQDGGVLGFSRNPDTDKGLPCWRLTLTWRRIYQTMDDSGVAGCVDADFRTFLAKETREIKVEDAAVKARHALAPELTIETLLNVAAHAQAEATRRFALYSAERDVPVFNVPVDEAPAIGSTVTVRLENARLGYGDGKAMVVIGRTLNLADESVNVAVWG